MGAGTTMRCGGTAGVARSRAASIWLLTATPASITGSEDFDVGLVTSRHGQKNYTGEKLTQRPPRQK